MRSLVKSALAGSASLKTMGEDKNGYQQTEGAKKLAEREREEIKICMNCNLTDCHPWAMGSKYKNKECPLNKVLRERREAKKKANAGDKK